MNTNHQTKPDPRFNKATLACLSAVVLGMMTGCGAADGADSSDPTPDVAQVQQEVGSCATQQINGNHGAMGWCTGYPNSTGMFRVVATCCPYCNTKAYGNWVYLYGNHTSYASCGTEFATALTIQFSSATG